MTLKLSRRGAALRQAEEAVDRHFAQLISVELGPLGALYARKRAQAEAGTGALLDGDREAILARAAEQDERVAKIDRERRDLKRRLRAAATAADVNEIAATIQPH